MTTISKPKHGSYLVYSMDMCPYCERAKQDLQEAGHQYEERSINKKSERAVFYAEVFEQFGALVKTMPQIFVEKDGKLVHIGGWSELQRSGRI